MLQGDGGGFGVRPARAENGSLGVGRLATKVMYVESVTNHFQYLGEIGRGCWGVTDCDQLAVLEGIVGEGVEGCWVRSWCSCAIFRGVNEGAFEMAVGCKFSNFVTSVGEDFDHLTWAPPVEQVLCWPASFSDLLGCRGHHDFDLITNCILFGKSPHV